MSFTKRVRICEGLPHKADCLKEFSLKVVLVGRCLYREYIFKQLRWLWEFATTCLVVPLPLAPLSENSTGIKLVMKL